MADVPHFRVPLRVSNGSLEVIEQDTTEEIEQCVDAVTRYRRSDDDRHGDRLTLPEFGIADPSFAQLPASGLAVDDLAACIERWEPRAKLLIEVSSVSIADAIVGVALRLRLTEGVGGA